MKPLIVKRFERNTRGRDLVIGDIHGHFSRVEQALAHARFDPSCDRLFSVGDLVNRGPESARVLEWLNKPWFHPVQGNHEQMAIWCGHGKPIDKARLVDHGGAWIAGMIQSEACKYADALWTLPKCIEVETAEGKVGIIHGEVFGAWNELIRELEECKDERELDYIQASLLWGRQRHQSGNRTPVRDVRAVVSGHTPVARPLQLGNSYIIETRGWRNGYFTLFDLDTLQPLNLPHSR